MVAGFMPPQSSYSRESSQIKQERPAYNWYAGLSPFTGWPSGLHWS